MKPEISPSPRPPDICLLPQETGSCDGYVLSWYYDHRSDRCLQFVYGGCEGNANRFESREDCESKCRTREAVTGLGKSWQTTFVQY